VIKDGVNSFAMLNQDAENVHSLCNPSSQQNFECSYYKRLFNQVNLPRVFQAYKPSDIFNFLEGVALEYKDAWNQSSSKDFREKLDGEFYIICMLNALFGDARFHLV
jgi:hypothetical protein